MIVTLHDLRDILIETTGKMLLSRQRRHVMNELLPSQRGEEVAANNAALNTGQET